MTQPVKPSPDGRPPARDPYQAEALLGIALCFGVGVLALPLELSTPLRWLLAFFSTSLVLYVFGRFPRLSQLILRVMLRVGPVVLVALAIAIAIVVLGIPRVSLSPAVIEALIAAGIGALAAVVMRFTLWYRNFYVPWKTSDQRLSREEVVRTLLFSVLLHGLLGALGVLIVRQAPGGMEFTGYLFGAIFVGTAVSALLYVGAVAEMPPFQKRSTGLSTPPDEDHQP